MKINSAVLAGWVLYLMILLSIFHGFYTDLPSWWAGLSGWLAALLLIRRVRPMQKIQSSIMGVLGVVGLAWGMSVDAEPKIILDALSANQSLVTMLAAVSFLRLITASDLSSDRPEPQGKSALWQTLLGVHAFGAVINLSAMMIMGEKLNAKQPISITQAATLSRGFGLAALWSPFFAAMGVALTNAPGAQLMVLWFTGTPIAAVALYIAGRDLIKDGDMEQFIGYPLNLSALLVPVTLAVLIMAGHWVMPSVSVLTLISFSSIFLSFLILTARFQRSGLLTYKSHIETVIPNIGSELTLFLAAGVFAVGISVVMKTAGISLGIEHFGAWQASGLLVLSLALAIAGVHPIITIATAGGLLANLDAPPNLLGMTFLMCWAGGVIGSPLSGMHLALAGRFNVSNFRLFIKNRRFSVKLLLLQIGFLHLYEALAVF